MHEELNFLVLFLDDLKWVREGYVTGLLEEVLEMGALPQEILDQGGVDGEISSGASDGGARHANLGGVLAAEGVLFGAEHEEGLLLALGLVHFNFY